MAAVLCASIDCLPLGGCLHLSSKSASTSKCWSASKRFGSITACSPQPWTRLTATPASPSAVESVAAVDAVLGFGRRARRATQNLLREGEKPGAIRLEPETNLPPDFRASHAERRIFDEQMK